MFVTLNLEADPVPTAEQIEWIKDGAKDMSVFPRCKLYTNGDRYLYECEEVRDQQDEVEVLYNDAAIGSREKINFHNKFQYHGG